MTPTDFAKLGPGDVVTVGSACPSCGLRDVVEVTVVLVAKPIGTFSLAGTQDKVSAVRGYVYNCTSCGASGNAAPKD